MSDDPFGQFRDNPYQPSVPLPTATTDSLNTQLLIIAIVLLTMAAITAVARVPGLVMGVAAIGQVDGPRQARLVGSIAGNGVALILNVVTIMGSVSILRRSSYANARTAAIVSVIPICSPCLIGGIPFGIWGLILLNKPEVKAMFRS